MQPCSTDVVCRVDALLHRAWALKLLICAETLPQHLSKQVCHPCRAPSPQELNVAVVGLWNGEQACLFSAPLGPRQVLESYTTRVLSGFTLTALWTGTRLTLATRIPCELAEAPRRCSAIVSERTHAAVTALAAASAAAAAAVAQERSFDSVPLC